MSGSISHLVSPSVRPTAWARPLAPQGTRPRPRAPCRLASVSLRPAQAISGSVNTTAGIARVEGRRRAREELHGHFALVGRLVRQHRLAGHVADGQDVRVGRPFLLVGDNEALLVELHLGVFQAQPGAVGPPAHRHQHAAIALALRGVVPAKVTSMESFWSARPTTLVFR